VPLSQLLFALRRVVKHPCFTPNQYGFKELSSKWHMRNISTASMWVCLWFSINIFGTHHTHSLQYSTLSFTISLTNNLGTSWISCSALIVTSLLAQMLSSSFYCDHRLSQMAYKSYVHHEPALNS
jgi:hypothetical protein